MDPSRNDRVQHRYGKDLLLLIGDGGNHNRLSNLDDSGEIYHGDIRLDWIHGHRPDLQHGNRVRNFLRGYLHGILRLPLARRSVRDLCEAWCHRHDHGGRQLHFDSYHYETLRLQRVFSLRRNISYDISHDRNGHDPHLGWSRVPISRTHRLGRDSLPDDRFEPDNSRRSGRGHELSVRRTGCDDSSISANQRLSDAGDGLFSGRASRVERGRIGVVELGLDAGSKPRGLD